MKLVADTDVLIDFLRGRGNEAARVEFELKRGLLYTTAVSAFELWAGAKSSQEKSAVGVLLSALSVIPLDVHAAERSGEVLRTLQAKGQTIGMAESLIAGICLHLDALLLTRNRKHFSRVTGLKLSGLPKTDKE